PPQRQRRRRCRPLSASRLRQGSRADARSRPFLRSRRRASGRADGNHGFSWGRHAGGSATLMHDPEKWKPVFGKDHAFVKGHGSIFGTGSTFTAGMVAAGIAAAGSTLAGSTRTAGATG